MKIQMLLFLLFFPFVLLPQSNFIEQITSGDFDARNPFIYKEEYGFYHDLFFELHKNNSSNIYSVKYNSDTGVFEDTVALTSDNSLNINPSYSPNLGLLFQTNKNGNWDIVLIPDSNGTWNSPRLLTNSLSNEVSPKFIETISSWDDSARILFERDGKIIYLSIQNDEINEEVIFQNHSNIRYSDFTGLQTENWGVNKGYYVFAVEDSSNHKKIVSRYKPFNGVWNDKTVIKDSCDCDDLSIQLINYSFWGMFFTDTLFNQRRFFINQNPFYSNVSDELVDIIPEGNLTKLDIYLFLIVTKRRQVMSTAFELYYPHTYFVEKNGETKIRIDISDLGFGGEDSLIHVNVADPNLAIGPVGLKNGLVTILQFGKIALMSIFIYLVPQSI